MKNKKVVTLIVLISIVIIVMIYKIVSINVNILNRRQIIKEMTESEYDNSITELNKSHTDYARQVQENKKKLAQAISNENVPTTENATVDEMVANIGKILEARTSDATVTADNITEGKTAWVNGELIIGNGTDNQQYYNEGYNNGSSKKAIKTEVNNLYLGHNTNKLVYTAPSDGYIVAAARISNSNSVYVAYIQIGDTTFSSYPMNSTSHMIGGYKTVTKDETVNFRAYGASLNANNYGTGWIIFMPAE